MADLRPELPPMPQRMRRLPIDQRGYPVPWFVAWIDGKPDHRVVDAAKILLAIRAKRCWVCGEKLGSYLAFVVGPMCVVNHTSGEPPSHRECAEYSARACPFMTRPHMVRREAGMSAGLNSSAYGLTRNPGVSVVYITRHYRAIRAPDGAILVKMDEPTQCLWYKEGRTATREEILASLETGLPALRELAEAEQASDALDRMLATALALVPAQ